MLIFHFMRTREIDFKVTKSRVMVKYIFVHGYLISIHFDIDCFVEKKAARAWSLNLLIVVFLW